MNITGVLYGLSVLLLFYLPAWGNSNKGNILLIASKQQAVIGEPVTLTLTLKGSSPDSVSWITRQLRSSSVVILKNQKINTIINGLKQFKQVIVFTLSEPDTLLLSSMPVIRHKNGSLDTLYTEDLTIGFRADKLIASLHPIKPINGSLSIFYKPVSGTLAILIIGVGATLFFFRQNWVKQPQVADKRWALESLARLEQQEVPGAANYEAFDVLKKFLNHNLPHPVDINGQSILTNLHLLNLKAADAVLLKDILEQSYNRFSPVGVSNGNYIATIKQVIANCNVSLKPINA